MLKNEIEAWLAANVEVQKLPATIDIHSCCRPELVVHLTYRYPNVKKSITIRDYLWYRNSNSTWNNDDFGRILDTIKETPPRNLL